MYDVQSFYLATQRTYRNVVIFPLTEMDSESPSKKSLLEEQLKDPFRKRDIELRNKKLEKTLDRNAQLINAFYMSFLSVNIRSI